MLAEILSLCIATTMLAPAVTAENYAIEMEEDIVIQEEYDLIPAEEILEEMLEVTEEKAEEPVESVEVEVPEEIEIEEKEEIEEAEVEKIDYTIALKEMGYYKEDYADKEINMRNAVLRFQSEHNLMVDGKFGEISYRALEKRLQDADYQYADVITSPPTEQEWIAINKTKRILTFYKGTQVIKKYPIAQGKDPSYTPEGKYTIVNRIKNPRWGGAGIAAPVAGGSPKNPLGYRWMGLSLKGGGSYGIHGNNQPKSIGTDASMGCVRMINSDVEELFEVVKLNTPVWIGTHEKLKEWGVHNKSYLN